MSLHRRIQQHLHPVREAARFGLFVTVACCSAAILAVLMLAIAYHLGKALGLPL